MIFNLPVYNLEALKLLLLYRFKTLIVDDKTELNILLTDYCNDDINLESCLCNLAATNRDMFEELLTDVNTSITNFDGLIRACSVNHKYTAKLLLAYGSYSSAELEQALRITLVNENHVIAKDILECMTIDNSDYMKRGMLDLLNILY